MGGTHPADDGGGVTAGDLVLAERVEELDVSEVAGVGLSETGIEGVEHPGEFQRPQDAVELMGVCHHATRSSLPVSGLNSLAGPWRCAGVLDAVSMPGWPSCSVPAARMPLIVR